MSGSQKRPQFTEQQKKALDLQRNLIVTAGAGSGKTTILVERYFKILLAHPETSVQNILAITFTEKAASEMKQRIVEKIYDQFRNNPKLQERLFGIIKSISEIQISTIHAFCSRVLRDNLFKTQLTPDFRIALQPEIDELLNRVFWRFFYSYNPDSKEELDLSFTALRDLDINDIKKIFSNVYYRRAIVNSFLVKYSKMKPEDLAGEWSLFRKEYYETLLRPFVGDRDVIESVELVKNGLVFGNKTAKKLAVASQNFLNTQNSSLEERITHTIELFNELYTKQGSPGKLHLNNIEKCKADVRQAFETLIERSQPLVKAFIEGNDDGGESLYLAEAMCGLSHLLSLYIKKVDEEKRRQQILDFDDLLIISRDLLKSSPETLDNLQQKFQWILVDEFQDTDAVQSEIIKMICTERNNVFYVGDPKQSIYSFRQADVSIFQEQLENIQSQPTEKLSFVGDANEILFSSARENKGVIELPHNFRSRPSLIGFYNYLFEKVFERESVYDLVYDFDVDFSTLSSPGLIPKKYPGRIGLHLINCEDKLKVEEYSPFEISAVIDMIKSLVGRERKYNPENGEWENVHYSDIAILTRDRKQWTQLTHDLQVAEIPFETYQGSGFFQSREVQDVYYLLKAISDPEDDFAFLASLRSPNIGVSDAGLFYLSRCRGGNYNERLQSISAYLRGGDIDNCFMKEFIDFLKKKNIRLEINEADRDALNWAAELLPRWNLSAHRGEYSLLLNEIIETLNIKAVLQSDEFGKQKIANLNKLMQFTYDFEKKSSGRITDFLEIFRGLMQGTLKEGEATLYFEGGDQVKILTIHGAKGLEFPVVILPFLEKGFLFEEDIHYQKNMGMFFKLQKKRKTGAFISNYFSKMNKLQTIAEEKRLLYVAATRTRDHLFFIGASGVFRETEKSYLGFVLSALGIDPTEIQSSESVLKEKFGFEVSRHKVNAFSQIPFPTEAKSEPAQKEAEGLPAECSNIDELLKYSQRLLSPIEAGEYSVTQLMIFEEDPDRYIHYHYFKNGVIYPPNLVEEYTDLSAGQAGEHGGLWWGTLVHKALENFHKRSESEDAVLVQKLINQFRIQENEIQSLRDGLIEVLSRFRKTKTGQHLLKCEQQSEVRIVKRFTSGQLLGIVDRIFRNESGMWEVLDFKTNRIAITELPSLVKKYTTQISYYAMLLASLFPQQKTYPVRLYFLSIDEEHQTEFEPEDIGEISSRAEAAIKKIQIAEEIFFGVDRERNGT
jgi:ATP-dependent helicase/nuclease subunit A